MKPLAGRWLLILVDVLHDLSAGAWPGAVAALWLVRRPAAGATIGDALSRLSWSSAFWVMFAAAVLLVVTGLVRVNYRGAGLSTEQLAASTPVALAKHFVFVTVFVIATVVAIRMLQP